MVKRLALQYHFGQCLLHNPSTDDHRRTPRPAMELGAGAPIQAHARQAAWSGSPRCLHTRRAPELEPPPGLIISTKTVSRTASRHCSGSNLGWAKREGQSYSKVGGGLPDHKPSASKCPIISGFQLKNLESQNCATFDGDRKATCIVHAVGPGIRDRENGGGSSDLPRISSSRSLNSLPCWTTTSTPFEILLSFLGTLISI